MWWVIIIITAPAISFFCWFRTIHQYAALPDPIPSRKYWWFFVHLFSHLIVTMLCIAGVFFENG